MTFRPVARVGGALCVAALTAFSLLGACSSGEEHPPPAKTQTNTGGKKSTGGETNTGGLGGNGSGGAPTTGGTGGDLGGSAQGGMGGEPVVPVNCGTLVCEGEGAQCISVKNGTTGVACVCKDGYLLKEKGDGFECVIDKTCVKVRPLENGCRVEMQGAPTVALFFGVDYCAGTAVLPEDLGNLDTAFKIEEDGQGLQVESKAKVIPRDVESFVTIALDVSSSVTLGNSATLAQLTDGLKGFLTAIQRPVDKPPITVSLLVFARDVGRMVPFTGDTTKIATALDAIKADPMAALAPVLPGSDGQPNLDGTTLMGAVLEGINETERMQNFRRVVTNNGVLSSGTLLVVTDGEDSNKAAVPSKLKTTLVNVISLGVSNEIAGSTLASIGRDGAFLAPTEESLTDAFTRIAKRVNEHPDRAYLLGYCSATTASKHTVKVTVEGKTNDAAAGCTFNADMFGSDKCDVDTFATKCDNPDVQCGSLFACGACSDDSCCAGTKCTAPSAATNCRGQDELCQPGQVCLKTPGTSPVTWHCGAPIAVGEACTASNRNCEHGAAYCDNSLASPVCKEITLGTGDNCTSTAGGPMDGTRCPEENCSRPNSSQPYRCTEQARMFDACSGGNASAVCERGTFCKTDCSMRGPVGLYTCSTDQECASGYCNTSLKLCENLDGTCHYNWDDKLN